MKFYYVSAAASATQMTFCGEIFRIKKPHGTFQSCLRATSVAIPFTAQVQCEILRDMLLTTHEHTPHRLLETQNEDERGKR